MQIGYLLFLLSFGVLFAACENNAAVNRATPTPGKVPEEVKQIETNKPSQELFPTSAPVSSPTSTPVSSPTSLHEILGVPDAIKESIPFVFQISLRPEVNGAVYSLTSDSKNLSLIRGSGLVSGLIGRCGDEYAGKRVSFSVRASSPEGKTLVERRFEIPCLGDPLASEQWHLLNTGQKTFADLPGAIGFDLNLQNAFASGLDGKGVTIELSDSGLDIVHPDLAPNLIPGSRNLNYPRFCISDSLCQRDNPSPNAIFQRTGDHGTSVAGIAAARGWNGVGVRGVAPLASLIGVNFLSAQSAEGALLEQANIDVDIVNQSWGAPDQMIPASDLESYEKILVHAVKNFRKGKGAIFVKAAGNDGDKPGVLGNANFDPSNRFPWVIVVGSSNALGKKSSYSSPGTALWISGPGGEFGGNAALSPKMAQSFYTPAMLTTDWNGCSGGFARADTGSALSLFNRVNPQNSLCDYTSTFNGTSAATPAVSGAIALLLQAHPELSWREVKALLARSARKIEPESSLVNGRSSGKLFPIDLGWTVNAAGYHFNNHYGFGFIDVDEMIRIADSAEIRRLPPLEVSPWQEKQARVAIPPFDPEGVSDSMHFSVPLAIEALQLRVEVGACLGSFGIELISPSGTRALVLPPQNQFQCGLTPILSRTLLVNNFYGEKSLGTWKLRVYRATTLPASVDLVSWAIRAYGHDGSK